MTPAPAGHGKKPLDKKKIALIAGAGVALLFIFIAYKRSSSSGTGSSTALPAESSCGSTCASSCSGTSYVTGYQAGVSQGQSEAAGLGYSCGSLGGAANTQTGSPSPITINIAGQHAAAVSGADHYGKPGSGDLVVRSGKSPGSNYKGIGHGLWEKKNPPKHTGAAGRGHHGGKK